MPAPGRPLEKLKAALRIGPALRLVWTSSRGWTVLSLSLVVVQSLAPLAVLYLIKLVVDAITPGAAGAGDVPFDHVVLLILLTALAGLVGAAAAAVSGLALEAQGHLVTDHVLDVMHEKSVEVDLAFYEDPEFHDTFHRAQREAPYRPTGVLRNLLTVLRSGLTVLGILGLLATVHPALPILLVLAVVPGLVVRLRHADRSYRWQRRRASDERRAKYLGWILTDPGHAKELRALSLGSELRDRFRDLRAVLRREKVALARQRTTAEVLAQVGAALAVFGSYAFIAYQTLQGPLSLGDLVMYFGAVQSGQALLQSLFTALGALYEDNLFLSILDDFLAVEPRLVAPETPQPIPESAWRGEGLRMEGVGFRYPGTEKPILKDVDLAIGPGEIVALVGPNGAGKSTLVKLLCRLYDPTSGRITLEGSDLRTFHPEELRVEIGLVFQDFSRFQLAAADNIRFGDVRRIEEEGRWEERPAREADIHGKLSSLGRGYDTILGRWYEEGEELSLGEWQKVALARAFASPGRLLVVDEPTSALDAGAEAAFFAALRTALRDRSALLISHRFSTVRMADRIYVLDGGRIRESGTHEELVRRGGRYAELFGLQAAPYRDGLPDSALSTGPTRESAGRRSAP